MGHLLDTTEIKHRARMGTLFSACDAQVEAGNVSEWISNEFPKDHLDAIAEKAGLPTKMGLELLKIAVFLDRALEMASARGKGPNAVKRELAALKVAHRDLVKRLSGLSPEAEGALAQVDEAPDEVGELSFRLNEPPVQEVLALLESLGTWLRDAHVSTERSGPKKSPKSSAVRLLRQLLDENKGETTPNDLTYLAEAIVEPVAERHGDESRLRDLVAKIIAEPEMMRA